MAYSRLTIVDRVITDGVIVEQGTIGDAALFNHMQDGIEQAAANADTALDQLEGNVAAAVAAVLAQLQGVKVVRLFDGTNWPPIGTIPPSAVIEWISEVEGAPPPPNARPQDHVSIKGA